MTTLNVPSISRKKPVDMKYEPSTFRVVGQDENIIPYRRPADKPDAHISQYDKTLHLPSWYYNSHYEPTRNTRCRENCSVNYLRRNVKTLNDPVCYIPSQEEAGHWWPNKVPSLEKPQPARQNASTMREDFQRREHHNNQGTMTRHMHNTSKPATGIIPVNWLKEDGQQRFHKENISYEHHYDSRTPNNYNNRARRQGAYIEGSITKQRALSMLDGPSQLSGWRTDSTVDAAPADTARPTIRSTSTSTTNYKRRSHFDIAPKSNLNVRVREYIPSVMENSITSQAPVSKCSEPNGLRQPSQAQFPASQAPEAQHVDLTPLASTTAAQHPEITPHTTGETTLS